MKHIDVKRLFRQFMGCYDFQPISIGSRSRFYQRMAAHGLYIDDIFVFQTHLAWAENLFLVEYKSSPVSGREIATGVGQLLLASQITGIENKILVLGEREYKLHQLLLRKVDLRLAIYNKDGMLKVDKLISDKALKECLQIAGLDPKYGELSWVSRDEFKFAHHIGLASLLGLPLQ